MYWNKIIKPASLVLTVALGAGAAVAGPLVVKASGPSAASYRPGVALADDAALRLKAGDVVVLLDGRGTRTLRGPGEFSARVASNQFAEARRTPIQATGTRARIGAVRGLAGIGASPRSPNIWFVDVGQSAKVCVTDPRAVTMWRGGPRDAAAMTITGSGQTGKVTWLANQATRDWPASLPIRDGAQYTVTGGKRTPATTLRFVVLPGAPGGLEETASMLIRNGCQTQLDLLVDTFSVASN